MKWALPLMVLCQVLLHALDVGTALALGSGAEGNPISAAIWAQLGIGAIIVLKAWSVAGFVVVWRVFGRHKHEWLWRLVLSVEICGALMVSQLLNLWAIFGPR